MANEEDEPGVTRRQFLDASAAGAIGLGLASLGGAARAAGPSITNLAQAATPDGRPYNILFVLTDQERYFDPSTLPPDFVLPGRARLQRRGVTFTNHQINAAVCTSSRAVIYTGRHIQQTRMFDNLDFPWSNDLDPDIGTVAMQLDDRGYYSAYKGKWHLSGDFGTHDELALPQEKLSRALERYGFRDYVGIGDVIGKTQGGYLNDDLIGMLTRRWLRLRGRPMNDRGQPWFKAVNLVNPHDVMFFNTDAPGENVQDNPPTLMPIAREPAVPFYGRRWDVALPDSRFDPLEGDGRPGAHREYQLARGALVGNFPNEDVRWQRLLNYYLNCILETDNTIAAILDELEALGLADSTIVVLTSDHGELGGAHGSHGKGATAYREQNHVPLIVAHPGYPATHGQRCAALTSHLDLTPTLLSFAAGNGDGKAGIARDLPGKDLTPLLQQGAAADVNAVREGALYCFNMFAYLDSNLLVRVQSYRNGGGDMTRLSELGLVPDFTKRGALRSVFDGRYKYTRYFSPKQHNQPRTLEGIFDLNDVELFDLKTDPGEINNLAAEPARNGELILAMNAKMNALLDAEIAEPDDGHFLPGEDADWAATRFDP